LNHLKLVASAPGYITTAMSVAVRSEPSSVAQASLSSSVDASFREEANHACEEGKAGLGPHTVSGAEGQEQAFLGRMRAVKAPVGEARGWAAYNTTIQQEQRPFAEVLAAVRAHETSRVYQANEETKALQRRANEQAAALGLDACVVPLP
jgi:hypothetical protein